jgi:hypothetical protein
LLHHCALFTLQNGEGRRRTRNASFLTECSCPAQRGDSPAKQASAAEVKALPLYDVVFYLFIRSMKPNLRTALTTQNSAQNICIISHVQNTNAHRPDVFVSNWNTSFTGDEEGTAVAQWLRYCATNWKVAGSVPDGVIGIFYSDRTMALGSTEPLTEISTRSISCGKGGRCVGLTTLPPSWAIVT